MTHQLEEAERIARTATRLGELLASPPYRGRWQGYVQRHTAQAVHQGAVAQGLARHLWDTGQVSENDVDLPRRLKDTVSRTLSGRVLTASTLSWFVEAFSFGPAHAAELWALRTGGDPGRLTVVRDAFAEPAPPAPSGLPKYQTISLHEFHTLGADGLPEMHRTVHVVRALGLMSTYPYRFDTDAAAVEVVRGGTAGPLYRSEIPDLYGVDITFLRPLQPGETGSFEYRTVFNYRIPPPPEFRRGARRRVDNVELHVQFHPDRLPVRLWWAIWRDHTERVPLYQEPAILQPDSSVHRYVDTLEGRTVGFHWRLEPAASSSR